MRKLTRAEKMAKAREIYARIQQEARQGGWVDKPERGVRKSMREIQEFEVRRANGEVHNAIGFDALTTYNVGQVLANGTWKAIATTTLYTHFKQVGAAHTYALSDGTCIIIKRTH